MNRIVASPLDGASDSAAAMQLLHAGSRLAAWTHSEAHARLPSTLQHGPVRLLQCAAQNADSPHISARLLDDTLVLLTYGVSYLETRGDRSHLVRRVDDFRAQRTADRAQLHAHALRIRSQFRSQRFRTQRLPPLQLDTDAVLIPEVQEMMRSEPPTSATELATVAVAVDDEQLQSQIDTYAGELRARVEARRRDAELQRQQQQRAQREQEDLKKKQVYQKRRRHENAYRRWNYFTGRLLRLHHQEIQSRVDARRRTILPQPQSDVESLRVNALRERQLGSSSRLVMSSPPPSTRTLPKRTISSLMASRNFIREFVAKVIARGVSRVLCESNMRERGSVEYQQSTNAGDRTPPSGADGSASEGSERFVLRVGILLCDLHFGAKYMGLYQRFLERAAKEKGLAIEWQLFDCVRSQFPTHALQRVLHAFLVAGGPNSGSNHAAVHSFAGQRGRRPDASESTADSDDGAPWRAGASEAAAAAGGRSWRKNLQKVLRAIYSDKRAALGGLGLGHVVLAEALGAKCSHREWEDGWSVLDPKLFDAKLLDDKLATTTSGGQQTSRAKYVGIKYLHGEFVQSMDFAPRSVKAWRSLDQRFVSSFRDRSVLSFDGFPECGTFVFETMSELYDREKQNQASVPAAPSGSGSGGHRRQQRGSVKHDRVTEEGAHRAIPAATIPARRVGVADTRLTLEEKKQLLDVTDISQVVAHALVDHFHSAAVSSGTLAVSVAPTTFEVAAVVNSVDCTDLREAIRAAAAATTVVGSDADGVKSVLLRVRGTSDGHLVVLNAQLEAFVLHHERKSWNRRPSVSLHSTSSALLRKNSLHAEDEASLLLSLHTLRDQKLVLVGDLTAASSVTASSSAGAAADSTRSIPVGESGAIAPGAPKRAPLVAKYVRTAAVGVLTLSEALSHLQAELRSQASATGAMNNSLERRHQAKPPSVILQFVDEESGSPPFRVNRRSWGELQALHVHLVAALRVAEIVDARVCVLSRQALVLAFFRKRQPLWTLLKDCRRSAEMPPRHHVRRVSWYARHADALLFDQEVLLSNSAKENEALFQQARYHGLRVFIARDDGSAAHAECHAVGTGGPSRKSVAESRLRKSTRSSQPSVSSSSSAAMEKDLQIVEILLLALTGIDGVLTSTPAVVLEAAQKLASRSPIIAQVEQLFRTWQAKGSGKAAPVLHKRLSLSLGDDEQDEGSEDYMGDTDAELVAAPDEREVALEMARQFAEHGVRRPPSSSSYVPLRPLQPKRGDQVLGAKREEVATGAALSCSEEATAQSHLRSIGTFRSAFQHRRAPRTPPQLAGTSLGPVRPVSGKNCTAAAAGAREALRAPELALSSSGLRAPRAPEHRKGVFSRR